MVDAAPPPDASPPPDPPTRPLRVTADIVGNVVRVDVAVGDAVQAGQTLLAVESMKMEIAVPAPADGTVSAVGVAAGDVVQEGDLLVELLVEARPEVSGR